MSQKLLSSVCLFLLCLLCVGGVVFFPLTSASAQSMQKGAEAAPTGAPASARIPPFSVASIKLNNAKNGRWRLEFTRLGYSGMGVTFRQIVEDAYGVYEKDRILNIPDWMNELKYDLVAKVDEENAEIYSKLSREQRQVALRALLAERCQLRVHEETRERSIYVLVIGKGGFKLTETTPGSDPVHGDKSVVTRGGNGELGVHWFTMNEFASLLSLTLSRHVVDKTGLTGRYDFHLEWSPESESNPSAEEPKLSTASGPSFFTVLHEKLGLELKVEKSPVQILVIDHVEKPTEN